MDKYTIVVMDYSYGTLRFFEFKKAPEDPERWLETHDPEWKDSQCYWMGVHGDIEQTYELGDEMEEIDDEH